MTRNMWIVAAVAAFVFMVIGYGIGTAGEQDRTDAAIASAVDDALAAVTPPPTPDPTPEATPVVEVHTVVITPPECVDAIDGLTDEVLTNLDIIVQIYSAYVDYPDETLTDFGIRVEKILDGVEPTDEAIINQIAADSSACKVQAGLAD